MMTTVPAAVWLPIAAVLAGVVIGLVADALGRRRASVAIIACGLAIAGVLCVLAPGGESPAGVGGLFVTGGGFSTLPALAYGLGAAAVAGGWRRLFNSVNGPGRAALVGLGALFSHMIVATPDLIVLFVSLGGAAVVSYGLVAGAGTRRAEEAAVRYVVQGAVATGLTVYGFGVLYALSGGVSAYTAIAPVLANAAREPALLALGLVLSVFAFKLGAFPFHSWVPDAYENADAPSVAFLASGPKVAGLTALTVLVNGTAFASEASSSVSVVLRVVAVASMAFGAFGMVRQRSVTRLLGYSAIAQIGYGLMGVSAGPSGVGATVVFAVTYAVGVAAAFLAVEAIHGVRPGWDGSIAGLAGLSRQSPLIAGMLAVSMLSLTGIPLLAGFWGKLLVFAAAVDGGQLWLAVIGGIAAVVSFAGYGGVINAAYFGPEDTEESPGQESESVRAERSAPGIPVAGAVLTMVVLILGLWPLLAGIAPLYALFTLG